jgi:hypothetical protein
MNLWNEFWLILFLGKHKFNIVCSVDERFRELSFLALLKPNSCMYNIVEGSENNLELKLSYIDFQPNMPCSLTMLEAGCDTLGGGILWYQTDCGTQTVLLGAFHSQVLAWLAALQIFSYQWGAVGFGN